MRKSDSYLKMKALTASLAAGFLAFAPLAAQAGFTKTQSITGGGHKTLYDKTIYIVDDNISVTAGAGQSAYTVNENATVVLYIPAGKTLTLKGGAGSVITGAGAGLEIPSSSTLIVVGGGKLVATGGTGGNGESGGNGGDAEVIDDDDDPHDEWGHAGKGGSGGSGGGGAGAGIGGKGGAGGAGRDEPEADWLDTDGSWTYRGYNGYIGNSGNVGNSGGKLYVLGTANVTATGGSKGADGGNAGSSGSFAREYWFYSYRAGGGGGGGGGGSGCAASAFGGGGGGGGAGGGGGEGGTYWTTQGYTERQATGGNGGGGSGGVSGSGTRTYGTSGWHDGNGGDGGIGGSSGSTGSGGTAYKSSTATVNGFSASESAESHSSIEYTITFDDGWRISKTATAKYGFALPAGPMASRYGYIFTGWYTGANGTGTRYYDANGASTVSLWTHPGDLTLYPGWEVNDHESLDEVALTVNGVAVSEGTDVSGTGWSYSAASGRIDITGADSTYEIAGKDLHGFAPIFVSAANCAIKITDELQMAPGGREGYNPITVQSGASLTLEVADGGECSLEGADGRTSVSVATGATLTLKTEGWLTATGGDDAADIGLDKDASSCGNIYIETYANWFARFRPGHGLSENNGLLNNLGKSANFISASTGGTLWSVRMPELEDAVMYLQRIDGDRHDAVQPGADGYAWFWVPTGGYEWAKRLDASLSAGDKLWICYVESQHSIASVFYPLHIEIDGEDIAHLNGKGWYATLTGSDGSVTNNTKATLVITDAGPHVVTGYGNAGIDIRADTSLTISNLTLTTSSWENKCAMRIEDGRTLNLTVVGDNRLTSGVNCPGIAVYPNRTINIDGDGSLRAQGGKNAAGIGGGYFDTCAGTINIKGGTITAIGGANAAGIGGGQTTRKSGTVTIAGGKVTARGGQYGAAIGGGYKGYADVVITGGTVFPTAGSKASAIGAGYSAGSVTVSEMIDVAAVYTTADKVSPSAKNGAGDAVFPVTFDFGVADCRITDLVINKVSNVCNDIWTNEKGDLVLWLTSTSGNQSTITIVGVDEDGNEIKKSWGVSIDGSGDYKFSRDIITVDGEPVVGGIDADGPGWDYFADTSIMTFRSGSHTLGGSSTNGSIRIVVAGDDVALTVQKLTLKTPYDRLSPFVVSNKCTLTLVDESTFEGIYNPNASTVSKIGSKYTAGLEVPAGASLTIEGDGTLTAIGGWCGAGIGSRGTGYENAGSITINGGYVYAIGGEGKSGGGAGIGGGLGGGVESITVNGGYVDATGGKGCCGIGGGWGRGIYLTNGTFRVTGGTVLAAKGAGAYSDFVTASGNTIDVTRGKSIVIDGACSVRPKNAVVANANPCPGPVNSNDVRLVFSVIDGLGPGDIVHLSDDIWTQYGNSDLLADDGGAICLWGESTNVERNVEIQSPNIPGGKMPFTLSAASNTITHVSDDYEAPESRKVNGVDCWRVSVVALPARKRLPVEGIDAAYSRGTTVSDATGMTYLYLPDGSYDFTVGGYAYHAEVNGGVATATFTVGILVDGVDIGACSGDGWSYNGTTEILSLNAAKEYTITGTNIERLVSVCAATRGVKIRADRLELAPAGRGAFYAADGVPSFEYAGGTLGTGEIPSQMVVSGGSIDATIHNPVAATSSGVLTNAYCVTIDGLPRFAKIDIANIEGLENYDTQGIYANEYGEVYLYLPDGDYWFSVSDGTTASEKIAIVDGAEAVALNYDPTGVSINGRDAARLRGAGWLNEDGLVQLLTATNYVLSGTNEGAAVTFQAQTSRTTLVFDNLVMTNAAMEVSPVSVGSGQKATFTVELRGTNILHGVSSDAWCGVEMLQMTELNFTGDGYLEATGQGPGIGMGRGEVADMSSVVIHSGTIVATGGSSAAGIGGGGGQDGIRTYVYGGSVTATGGAGGAGIGGGYNCYGAAVTITNGVVVATGGAGGAGIGGGRSGGAALRGACEISGGIVTAQGGDGAAGIGGGRNGASGFYVQQGGTVVAHSGSGGKDIGAGQGGTSAGRTTVSGGSLNAASAKVAPAAKNASAESVYCVTVPIGRANFDIGAAMTDFAGYSLSGAVTDDEGKIYVWLPDGKYYINIANRPYRAIVDGADAEAEVWSVGVAVDGVDVALQSGEGWTYSVDTGLLSVFADGCVISGTNTAGDVSLAFTNSLSAVVSNLCIATSSGAAASPVSILSNAVVKLALAGTNGFASAGEGCAGLNVPYGSSLSITNLVEDAMPYLAVRGANYAAGIGGGRIESHGSIEILGGAIVATGGAYGAGIGSGYFSESGSDEGDAATLRQGLIRILGGDVSATGGERAAGIGGGWTHSGGEIEIAGGKVTATSAMSGAGIGGGMAAHGYTISISGGEVSATGGSNGGAGIGGGIVIVGSSYSSANTALCRIAISGGRIAATGGAGSAGIGSGKAYSQHAAISITGGTVVATGGESIYGYSTTDDIGIGACDNPVPIVYPLTIKGASVHALNRTASAEYVSPAPSNGTTRVWCVTVETGKPNELVSVEYLDGYGEDSEIYADEEGKVYLWLPDGSRVFYVGGEPYAATVGGADTTAHEWLTGVTADGLDVSHVQTKGKKWYYDYGEKRLYVIGDCVVSGTNTAGQVNILASPIAEDEGGAGGSFAFTVSNLYLKSSSASPLAVSNGTVTVRLAGANTLDASPSRDYAALNVGATATLVVTNLEENAALMARGGTDGAGIGGNRGGGTGTIRIEGGVVNAYGIDDGAGIGSGYKGTCGDISITGGRVTAIGGTCTEFFGSYCGAGIGGGDSSDSAGCRIEISGGTVVAESDIEVSTKYAALIGDGYSSKTKNGYSISITGGSIMSRRRTSRNTFFTESKASDTPNIPVDGAGAQVDRSSLSGYAANARVDLEIDGYGTNDIYADYAGAVHLWIAPGVYNASIGSVRYLLKVTESGGTLEELLPTGVFANGVDVYETSGAGWTYDPAKGTLSIAGDATLSGTNTEGIVRCRVETGANVVFSNLCLKATGNRQTPFAIASNATVSVAFTGTNTLAAGKYCAAIEVPYESGVSIGGDGWLYAAGGGGDDWSYPGIGASDGMYQAVSNVVIRSGNIVATTPEDFIDSISGALVAGGNVNMRDSNSAVNSDGALLDRVKVANLPAGKAVEITGLPAYYDVSNICADDSGNIYLWLPRGNYAFTVDGTKYFAGVAGSATTALVQDVDVTINGESVCTLSGGGWYYDVADRTLYVTNQGTYTVTGTNDEGKVAIYLKAEDGPVELVLKDLHLSGYTRDNYYSPIVLSDIWDQQPVTLTLVSSNSLVSCADSTYHKYAGIYVPYARTLTIAGDGHLAVRGNSGAAIGGLDEYLSNTRRCGNIYITGGRIVARGSSSAIGSCDGQSCGDIVISGGTVEAETTSGQAIGTGGAFSQHTVVITGGSVKATDAGAATVAVNASDAALSCVEVSGLAAGTVVAFDGLPAYYGTAGIYADADGKAYLWLPEDWTTPVTPKLLAASRRRLTSAAGLRTSGAGATHTFVANGYRYTVEIPLDGGEVVSEKGEALQLESVTIDGFAVEGGRLTIRLTARPATWLYGFVDTLRVRASETLPIPDDAETLIDMSTAELRLEDGDKAVIAIPLPENFSGRFFKVEGSIPAE